MDYNLQEYNNHQRAHTDHAHASFRVVHSAHTHQMNQGLPDAGLLNNCRIFYTVDDVVSSSKALHNFK